MKKEIIEDDLLILFLDEPCGEESDYTYEISDDLIKRYENARNDLRVCLKEIKIEMNKQIQDRMNLNN